MDGGYVKIWRKLLSSPIMSQDGLCRLWIWCIMLANWKAKKSIIPGTCQEVVIPRGSFLTTMTHLHASLYRRPDDDEVTELDDILTEPIPSPRTLWRRLHSLKKMGSVSLKTVSRHGTIVTLCNYETYQAFDDDGVTPSVTPLSHRCHTDAKAPLVNEKGKKERTRTQPSEDHRPKTPDFDPFEAIPAALESPQFRAAWAEWLSYRRGRRLSSREATLRKQLDFLASFGVDGAADSIHQSIRNGWQGLFEPRTRAVQPHFLDGLKEFAARAAADGSLHKEHGT